VESGKAIAESGKQRSRCGKQKVEPLIYRDPFLCKNMNEELVFFKRAFFV
jgi:hypothetical protein